MCGRSLCTVNGHAVEMRLGDRGGSLEVDGKTVFEHQKGSVSFHPLDGISRSTSPVSTLFPARLNGFTREDLISMLQAICMNAEDS